MNYDNVNWDTLIDLFADLCDAGDAGVKSTVSTNVMEAKYALQNALSACADIQKLLIED